MNKTFLLLVILSQEISAQDTIQACDAPDCRPATFIQEKLDGGSFKNKRYVISSSDFKVITFGSQKII